MERAETIWWWFKNCSPFTDAGIAGLIGNFEAESSCESVRLQGDFAKDRAKSKQYVAAIDSGEMSINQMAFDGSGFGIAQWTFSERKRQLATYCKSQLKSIGDIEAQCHFALLELAGEYSTEYRSLYNLLCTTTSVQAASDAVLTQYERPANMGEMVKTARGQMAQSIFNKYSKKEQPAKEESVLPSGFEKELAQLIDKYFVRREK